MEERWKERRRGISSSNSVSTPQYLDSLFSHPNFSPSGILPLSFPFPSFSLE
uniref:Protein arginine N-methyltransferase n=1 Tax=Rhizophora mucronata TaxID=61149 RepID=A0A2P2MNZ7_RHIMU